MPSISINNFSAAFAPKAAVSKNFYMLLSDKLSRSPTARIITLFFMLLAAMVICQPVMAWTVPTTGSFGYNIYEIAITKVANGPIGFVGGGWLIATGATKMNEGWMRALPYVIGGSCLIKLEDLTKSLGAIIS